MPTVETANRLLNAYFTQFTQLFRSWASSMYSLRSWKRRTYVWKTREPKVHTDLIASTESNVVADVAFTDMDVKAAMLGMWERYLVCGGLWQRATNMPRTIT
jgi:hypothetical protein